MNCEECKTAMRKDKQTGCHWFPICLFNNARARQLQAERERDEARSELERVKAERDAAIKALTEIEQRTTYLDKNVNASGDKQIASVWSISHEALKAMKP